MMNLTVFGQTYPVIHQLTGGFTFAGEKLEQHTQVFGANTPTNCTFNFGNTYKYYSFKAVFDMAFAFDIISDKTDFNFIVWKLTSDKQPTAIFDRGGTIVSDRSVYDSNLKIKGMKDGESERCEYFSGNGYVNSFSGTELLKKDETVVIAVYGLNTTDLFDIKINVATERSITKFNTNCFNQAYTYQQIYDEIKTNSGLDNITIFTDNTFNTVVNTGSIFSSETTLYAQVKDAAGSLKYIYTIPLKFIAEHQFNFNTTINPIFECTNSYTLKENVLLNVLFPNGTDISKYKIKSVNGTSFVENSQINLTSGNISDLKIIVSYIGSCPTDSTEKIIQVRQGTPPLSTSISDVTCSNNYIISFDTIFLRLLNQGIDKSQYDLVVTLNGTPITDGMNSPISSTLTYKVKVKSKTAGCESNEIDFVVNKTAEANIINAEIKDICLDDFIQKDVDDAIVTIKSGGNYTLKYFQADGITSITDLFTYIKITVNGKVIVKALANDNSNSICDTQRELRFNLNKSSFVKVNSIEVLKSSCTEVGAGKTFTKIDIENYLKSKLGNTITGFKGISDVTLTDNESKTIAFQVQVNGEICWSEEMQLTVQNSTKPNFISKILKANYCDGDILSIDDNLLKSTFGSTILDYEIYIDGTKYTNGTTVQKVLNFGLINSEISFPIEVRSNGCSQSIQLNVGKKSPINLPPNFTQDIENRIIEFCSKDTNSAITDIDQLKAYIKTTYGLETFISSADILKQFTASSSRVTLPFFDPTKCGNESVVIYYQKNDQPNFEIKNPEPFCTGSHYLLDFEKLATEKGLNVADYNYQVTGNGAIQIPINEYQYELKAGSYKIIINKIGVDACAYETDITVSEVIPPAIQKITITDKSIIVVAKGDGNLTYALFDENDDILVPYQSSNELIIPGNLKNYNFKVRVSANNCAISAPFSVTYLSLPNVVTPNNDGINDLWKPMGMGDTTNSYQLIIFDRYGKQIYYKEGVNIIQWDGTLNGKPLPDDTYWYMLKPINESNILQIQYSGSILVKRKTK